jgi:hypothetical protein
MVDTSITVGVGDGRQERPSVCRKLTFCILQIQTRFKIQNTESETTLYLFVRSEDTRTPCMQTSIFPMSSDLYEPPSPSTTLFQDLAHELVM